MSGDIFHIISLCLFYIIIGIKGNAAGVSLKAQELSLIVFVTRYLDVFTDFYSTYNTFMKLMCISITGLTVYTIRYQEPARSTYSPRQDTFNHWQIALFAAIFAMLAYFIGSGVVDIKGDTGEEFEVHFERYELASLMWTFSICLEPFAMLPQLYMFWNNRMINLDVRLAMFFRGCYRMCYIIFWFKRGQVTMEHHFLVYAAGVIQLLLYTDFIIYHIGLGLSALKHTLLGSSEATQSTGTAGRASAATQGSQRRPGKGLATTTRAARSVRDGDRATLRKMRYDV